MAESTRPLIVYYSHSGKTRMVANKLAALLDADVEEILEAKARGGLKGRLGAGRDALLDRPAELISQHSTKGRTVVILGMPVWAGSPPPAVRQYVRSVDLTGKNVAAFCTHNGGGGKGTFAKLAELLPETESLLETLAIKRPKPDDTKLDDLLKDWAGRITTRQAD